MGARAAGCELALCGSGGGAAGAAVLPPSVDGEAEGGGITGSAPGGGGGEAAGSEPPRKASALYCACVRSATKALATCFWSSVDVLGGALSGVSASAGYLSLASATVFPSEPV